MSRVQAQVKPHKAKVTRVAMYSNSREGESLEEFMKRSRESSKVVVDGVEMVCDGIFEKKFLPACGGERWVTKFMEKHYAE